MEENKKCVDGICEKCSGGMCGGGCCSHRGCGHHHCHRIILRIILGLILVSIGFCAGSMAERRGELRGWEGERFMMNGFYGPKDVINDSINSGSGSTTVKVLPPTTGTKTTTTTPPVLQ